ncbi:unnamed protein product [Leptidea sinapis]|uniref:Uncharacterized protein n=1 Tax=Leptidea sinapis TaxID=189913 RepID=A0A5E4PRJ9_9NEOP|nr:unnamed protein product [Leptidea sinapis]
MGKSGKAPLLPVRQAGPPPPLLSHPLLKPRRMVWYRSCHRRR